MNLRELEQALYAGTDCEEWTAQLARYFSSYELSFGHGTDNAADEAYWLVRAVQSWEPNAWLNGPDPAQIPRLLELAGQRVEQRKPLGYLLGEAWFAGLRFAIDERVLIPRSPLAELIEARFAPWCELRSGDRVLDIGTGSGCLAIAAAHHCPDIDVDATEISLAALAVAAANVRAFGLEARVTLHAADLFPSRRAQYRVIVANPPYVPEPRLDELPPEYGYEPRMGLNGGPVGLASVARILRQAPAYMAADGVLIVEVGEAQPAFAAAYSELPVTWLEFERGGSGVLLITCDELTGHSAS
jgi:ribosomal protein L3 glutamine methyltransferase